MADRTILGMPLDADGDDALWLGTPLEAVVIVKMLNGNGDIAYVASATAGLKDVEALGMLHYARLRMETGMTARMADEQEE
jgi:hypothetical protein